MNNAWKFLLIALKIFLLLQWTGCTISKTFTIEFNSRQNLQVADQLTMNDVVVGQVKTVELSEDGSIICVMKLDPDYSDYVKTSAVFSSQKDPDNPGRQRVIGKNCDRLAPVIESGHTFSGMGMFGYALACIGHQSNDVWESFMRQTLEELVSNGGDFSSDTQLKIEAFARSSGEAFAQTLSELTTLVNQLDETARETLDDIQSKHGTK